MAALDSLWEIQSIECLSNFVQWYVPAGDFLVSLAIADKLHQYAFRPCDSRRSLEIPIP
jgi:hypothetical protein